MEQTVTVRRRRTVPVVFAILGLLAAGIAGGVFWYREVRPTTVPRLTPQETVEKYLTAVFAWPAPAESQLAELVCSGWEVPAAISRTWEDIPADASVNWRDVETLTVADGRAVVSATVIVTVPTQGDAVEQRGWRFGLVDESGWRVCEARRITALSPS